MSALTTCPLRRPTRERVSLLLGGGQTTIPGVQQCRPLSQSTSTPGGEGGGQEETGTYSEADHEHAVISAFDLLYVRLVACILNS